MSFVRKSFRTLEIAMRTCQKQWNGNGFTQKSLQNMYVVYGYKRFRTLEIAMLTCQNHWNGYDFTQTSLQNMWFLGTNASEP